MKANEVSKTQFLNAFEQALRCAFENGDSVLDEGMRYAMLDGGKRIRPICVYLGAMACGGDVELEGILHLAMGIECIHGYSLVHDDLPAMDNDDYRRGKLSVHKKFGYANGILIGDQLLTKAMDILLDGGVKFGTRFANASKQLSHGGMDMVCGQVLDLDGCKTKQEYLDMYAKKTGALIVSAFLAGAICAGADDMQIANVKEFAKNIGLGFQLADDLIDEGEENSLLAVIGKDETVEMLKECTKNACDVAKNLCCSDMLARFAKELSSRKN